MPLSPPSYMVHLLATPPEVRYRRDDWQLAPFFECHDESQIARWAGLHDVAIRGLTIALAEWLVFHLQRLDRDPAPLQILEAAWCANIDHRYAEGLELAEEDWRGPRRRPMGIAFSLINEALYEQLESASAPVLYPCLMAQLVRHVCAAEHFDRWLERCLARLRERYTAPEPLDDLYDEASAGLLVPREVGGGRRVSATISSIERGKH